MRDKSGISVLLTTSESMLNPLAARMPDTRLSTPGSFVTKQLSVCRTMGADVGGGVLYKMLETASSAVGTGLEGSKMFRRRRFAPVD